MNNFKKTMSKFFSKVKTFISEHKKESIIVSSILAFIIVLIIILIIVLSTKKNPNSVSLKKIQEKTTALENIKQSEKKVDPNALWLLEEPLKLPPIQFSREQQQIWKQDEINYWYEPPSKEAIQELHKANKKLIDKLLEEAP